MYIIKWEPYYSKFCDNSDVLSQKFGTRAIQPQIVYPFNQMSGLCIEIAAHNLKAHRTHNFKAAQTFHSNE